MEIKIDASKYVLTKGVVLILLTIGMSSCNGDAKTSAVKARAVKTTKTVVDTSQKPLKPVDSIHTSVLEFIDIDENGDNNLLVAHKSNDTVSYISNVEPKVKLRKGDVIEIKWKTGTYVPAGDPEYPVQREFVIGYKLIKKGKLANAILQKRLPYLPPFFYEESLTDSAKDWIAREVAYYITNTTQPDIKKIMDNGVKSIPYTVAKKTVGGKDIYVIWFTTDEDKPQPIHQVYYDFEKPYQLYEVNE